MGVAASATQRAVIRGTVPAPAWREKEVLITGVSELQGRKTAAEIAAGLGEEDNSVQGVRKLSSGAFAVSFRDAAAKVKWVTEKKGSVLKKLEDTVRVKVHTLNVIVCRFPGGSVSRLSEDQRIAALRMSTSAAAEGLAKAILMKALPF